MKPAILQVIAFRTIFQVVLRKWKFNLPTAFFVMSSLDGLVPDHIIEEMFSMIQAKNGQISQTIELLSYDPEKLTQYLANMINIRTHILFLRKPLQYVRSRYMTYLFSDILKCVRSHIVPHIDCNLKSVLRGVIHTVELTFDTLMFENDTYVLNHKQMN